MDNVILTPNSNTEKKNAFQKFLEAFPILQLVGAVIIGLAATWTTIRLTQSSQAAEIRRQSEKIERLEKDTVSRELFDERTLKIIDEQKEQRKLLERLLEKK